MTWAETTAASANSATGDPEPLRSDARHNRARILAVAREALCAPGEASLNSIAKRARVGPGTLYRHFPSREDLVFAVYQEDVRTLTDSPADLLAQHKPLQALRVWCDRFANFAVTNRNLADALEAASRDGVPDGIYARVSVAAALLLSACQQEHSIRPDVTANDVLLLVGSLWRIEPGPDAAARVSRLLDLIVSGLQADGPRSLSRARSRSARSSLRLRRRLALVSLRVPRSR